MPLKTSDIILSTISVLGKLRIQKFNDLFNTVWEKSKFNEQHFVYFRGLTLRFLDSLGHIEYDFEGRYIYACEPLLVLLPTKGAPRVVLTGARNSELLERLKEVVKRSEQSVSMSQCRQASLASFIPPAIFLEAVDESTLRKVASEIGVSWTSSYPVSLSILELADGISEIEAKLRYEQSQDINWSTRIFSLEELYFTSVKDTGLTRDVRLIEYTNRFNSVKQHWLWIGNTKTEISRDWGRYVLLSKYDKHILKYDAKKYLLGVPSTVPLPVLISRGLILCTGLVPHLTNFAGRDYLVYKSVNPQLAEFVAAKLRQALSETAIDC